MSEIYRFAGFRLDATRGELSCSGSPIALTAKSRAVLTLLVRSAPGTVSREQFESAIWPEGFIEPSNLTQTIYMIRKALGVHYGGPLIDTLNMQGYRIAIPVESVKPVAATAFMFRRMASSFAIAVGLALVLTMFSAHATPLPLNATHQSVVHLDHDGGTVPRGAADAPMR